MIYPNDSPDFWCLEWMISSISSPKIFFGDDLFGVWRCWSSVGETNSAQHIQHIHILLQNYVFWNVKQNYIWFKYDLYIFSFLSPNSSITVLFAVLKVTKVHQFPSQDLWSISTFLAYHIVPTLSWQKTTYIYIYCIWMVVSNMFFFFHSVGNVIIPTDFNSMMFQRGRFKPPTSYC